MVAMAQTVPVLTAGLDLSVGAVMTMVGCFASYLLVGTAGGTPFSRDCRPAVSASAACRAASPGILLGMICLRRDRHARRVRQRLRRRLRTHPADHRDARDRRDLYRHRAVPAPDAGRQDRRGPELGADQFARRFRLDRAHFQRRRARPGSRPSPGSRCPSCCSLLIALLVWVPFRRTVTGRDRLCDRLGRRRRLHVGPARSSAPRSPLSRSAAFSPAAAACSSRSRPRRATPIFRRPAPTR